MSGNFGINHRNLEHAVSHRNYIGVLQIAKTALERKRENELTHFERGYGSYVNTFQLFFDVIDGVLDITVGGTILGGGHATTTNIIEDFDVDNIGENMTIAIPDHVWKMVGQLYIFLGTFGLFIAHIKENTYIEDKIQVFMGFGDEFHTDRSTSRMMYSFFYQVCTDIFEDIPSAFISVMLISISGEKWSSPTNILTFINILSSFVGTFLSMAEIVVQFYLEDFVIAQSQIGSSRESDDVDPVCTAIVFFIIYFFPYFFIFVFTPLIFASKMTQVVLLNNST